MKKKTAKLRLIAIRKELRQLIRDYALDANRDLCGDCARVEQTIAAVENVRENWWSGK